MFFLHRKRVAFFLLPKSKVSDSEANYSGKFDFQHIDLNRYYYGMSYGDQPCTNLRPMSSGSDSSLNPNGIDFEPSDILSTGLRHKGPNHPWAVSSRLDTPEFSRPSIRNFRNRQLEAPLFSKADISEKFREIGAFYQALNGLSNSAINSPSQTQITDAVRLWFRIRFAIPKEGHVVVPQKAYDRAFGKLYGYISRLKNVDVAGKVLVAVDQVLNVGRFDAKKASYQISQTDLETGVCRGFVPEPAGSPSVLNDHLVGQALGEALCSVSLSENAWRAMIDTPSVADMRVMAFFEKSMADVAKNKKDILGLCLARVVANPDMGLILFKKWMQTTFLSTTMRPIFDKLNKAYLLTAEDKRIAAFDTVLSDISDDTLKENLQLALLVLAKIHRSLGVSASEIQSEFAGDVLHGCMVETLDVLLDRFESNERDFVEDTHSHIALQDLRRRTLYSSGRVEVEDDLEAPVEKAGDGVAFEILKLPFVPVHAADLVRAFRSVTGVLDMKSGEKPDFAQGLGISEANLDARCKRIRHAYAKHTIDTTALWPEPSLLEKLVKYGEDGVFCTHRDISAAKYTAAEQGAAHKVFDFYFHHDKSVILKGGKIDPSLGLDRQELQALYGISAVNKYAFDVLSDAAKQMGVYDRFLSDMRQLQDNPVVQKLIANRLRVDGALHPIDRQTYHEFLRFFSATLPGDLSLFPVSQQRFDHCKDFLPRPVRDRIDRGLLMMRIVRGDTALRLTDTSDQQTQKASLRALVFEFSRKGGAVFADTGGGSDSKRAEWRNILMSCFSRIKDVEDRTRFCQMMQGRENSAAREALNNTCKIFSASLSGDDAVNEKDALCKVFPLQEKAYQNDDYGLPEMPNAYGAYGEYDIYVEGKPFP